MVYYRKYPTNIIRVSPTSIRSRILKDRQGQHRGSFQPGFTHVDPFEDTESSSPDVYEINLASFTHVDPFEDTERLAVPSRLL